LGLHERAGLRIVSEAEVERERRHPRPRLDLRDVAARREHADHDDARGDDGSERHEREDPASSCHDNDLSRLRRGAWAAIQSKAMSSYRDLLQAAKAEIEEGDAKRVQALIDEGSILVDVRERDEWEQGRIPGAVHIPRGYLESRIEQAVPDRSQPVVLYCAAGNRSAFAAKTLADLGYERPVSLAGGYTDWQRNGLPTELPRTLGPARQTRYSRHLLIPDVEVVPFRERLTSENIERILEPGWDVIVDGADNFPTRYLVNDASVWHDIPVVHGSIFRFEGQVTVFKPGSGPCYRCLFAQ